jgi:hypothetical protein
MSKLRASGRKARWSADELDAADEALSGCVKITILGKLLAAARPDIQGRLESEVVVQSGRMIAQEAERLHEFIRRLWGRD